MLKVVGVKFKNTCKLYYFAPLPEEPLKKGDFVIVETSKGQECASVVAPEMEVTDDSVVLPLKPVLRKATAKDLERVKRNESRRDEAMKLCRSLAEKYKLEMKVIDCEFAFEGNKVVFSFSAPNRIDFRDLVKDLAAQLHLRIELRQVGIRDETRILGGIAPCGRPCCCACGVVDFKKVTIKMAKTQGLSLNPGKISGLCGRLMCCLEYENDYYAEASKKMPKIGSETVCPDGTKAIVASVNMLKMEVKVKIENKDGGLTFKDYPVEELNKAVKVEKECSCPCAGAKSEKPEKSEKTEKAEKVEKTDRPEKNGKNERGERPARSEKGERAERGDRSEKNDRPARSEKGERPDRRDRRDRDRSDKNGKNASANKGQQQPQKKN